MRKKVYLFAANWCPTSPIAKGRFRFLRKQINVYGEIIDVDTEYGADLSVKYGVRNVPTFVVIDENKQELFRVKGADGVFKLKTYLRSGKF